MKIKVFAAILVIMLFCSCTLEDANVIGPAGGFVFYDKGNYSDGWRYLESSPIDAGVVSRAYLIGEFTGGSSAIGMGKQNTDLILAAFDSGNNGIGRAAQLCSEFYFGGYNDWFLPSKDELNQMIKTAVRLFPENVYLTSTYVRTYEADWAEGEIRSTFESVKPSSSRDSSSSYQIRPIRRF